MKKYIFSLFSLFCLATFATRLHAQVQLVPLLSDLHLEARAEFEYINHNGSKATDDNLYGFRGRYFNFRMGGNLTENISYYFRQRIIAMPGSSAMFDNTDFLYINYKPSAHWSLRAGKDALMVGGFEYDAAPIDVYFNTYSWDMIYCFQLATSAAYSNTDGSQSLVFQIANSPYVFSLIEQPSTLNSEYQKSLLSYNLFWAGNFNHFHTLYSVNLFERQRGVFMNYIALGNKLIYDKWDIYIDFMHHSLAIDDWGKNFGIVSCANIWLKPWISLFVKGGYETNHSSYEVSYADFASPVNALDPHDILSRPETDSYFLGVGTEIIPTFCKDLRIYACVSQHNNRHPDLANPGKHANESMISAKLGLTWFMDIHRMARERILFLKDTKTE